MQLTGPKCQRQALCGHAQCKGKKWHNREEGRIAVFTRSTVGRAQLKMKWALTPSSEGDGL